jgi:hypothetical protein
VAFLIRKRQFSAILAQALIVALLIGGLPLFTGVIITRVDGAPALTLNICNPLPGLNQGSGFFAVPLPDGQPSVERPTFCGTSEEVRMPPVLRASERPDTPPPKALPLS